MGCIRFAPRTISRLLASDRMGTHPIGEWWLAEVTRRHFQDNLFLLVYRGVEFVPIQHEERFHCRLTDALITVNKRMILDQRESQRSGLVRQSGVEILPAECHG